MHNEMKVWMNLGQNTGEMILESAQVIGYRTSRMAFAGPVLQACDQREWHLMSQEKIEVAAESMQAMLWQMLSVQLDVGLMATNQVMTGLAGVLSLTTCFTPEQSQQRQNKIVNDTLKGVTQTANKISTVVADVAQEGLKPIQARTKANVKRLQ